MIQFTHFGVAGVEGELLVVSPAGVEPRKVEPFERHARIGTAIDEIADREEAVGLRVEVHLVEQGGQTGEHPVDVADDEVASGAVARVTSDDPAGTQLGGGHVGRELGELHDFPNEPTSGRETAGFPSPLIRAGILHVCGGAMYRTRPSPPATGCRSQPDASRPHRAKIALTRSRSAGVSTPGPAGSRETSTWIG